MTRQETVKALSVLRAAYPAFYSKQPKGDVDITVNLWCEMFAADSYEVVMIALKELISRHSGFPPDIADLRKQIQDMTFASIGEPTNEELWRCLVDAVHMGWDRTKEAFESLPPVVKRYLGSPETLAEFGRMEESTFYTVTKGQFMKQIEAIRDRERFERETPDDVKSLFASEWLRLSPNRKQLSVSEINDRRNHILDALEDGKR